MSTVLQQLRAEYEASTQGEWSVFARQGLNPGEEEWFLGYEITGPEQPSRGQFVRRADAALCVAAHNNMPLLLAVAEAAADVVAWHGTVQDLFRKEARGDEVSVSEMSRANSEWSDAMDRLSAALAVEEAQ